jgi:hypothetical protein
MRLALPILMLLAACGPKVAVQVAGNPAVALPDLAVAVVAQDRACQPLADALVEALWAAKVPVNPRATTRVEVAVCGDDLQFDVEQHVHADAPGSVERRTQATARAHGLVIVSEGSVLQAHLIGIGRHQTAHSAERTGPIGAIGRTARLSAIQDAAQDLSEQLSPSPVTVDRRVWPNAPEASHRGLTTQAVWAEQRGDMGVALSFASQAYDRRPNDRGARYVADLERRGRYFGTSPLD